jgi:hypothetical protein
VLFHRAHWQDGDQAAPIQRRKLSCREIRPESMCQPHPTLRLLRHEMTVKPRHASIPKRAPLAVAGMIRYPQRTFGGGLAERLRSGLQIREDRFDSGTRLHLPL